MAESESKAKLTVKLTQEDIPGAKLPRDSVEKCSVVQLKRWLLCTGAKTTGTKKALVSRFVSKLATFKLRTFTRNKLFLFITTLFVIICLFRIIIKIS